jgi:hypothetical protein
LRLLAAGVTVARTADDLLRYLTYLDIEQSRSFGVVARGRDLVRQAAKLFEAGLLRNPYEPGQTRW